MPSRMERYADIHMTRTERNKDLYNQIYEDGAYEDEEYTNKEYSNIEGVVKAPATNSVDIEKVKEILNRREEAQKFLQGKTIDKPSNDLNLVDEEDEEIKNYDIKDVLDKAKEERPIETSEHHSLKDTEFNILKNLNVKKDRYVEDKDDELKELINTITNTSMLNKIDDKELSLDLLDNLKPSGNTEILSGTDVIKNVLQEEKDKNEDTEEMDSSFYTKSLNLTDDLEDLRHDSKTNKIMVKIFVIITIIAVVAVGAFITYTLVTKK